MGVTSPTAAGTANLSTNQRLDQVQRELADQRRRLNRSTTLVSVVGVIVIVAIAGYFYYGYNAINEATQPKAILDFGQQKFEDSLPEFRKQIEQQLKDGAPDWAQAVSKVVFEKIPEARKTLEEHAIAQVDKSIDEANLMTEQQFRTFLKDHRAQLEQKFKELSESPHLAETSLNDVVAMLEESQKGTMKTQADELLSVLLSVRDKLAQLRVGKKLTRDAQKERQLLMIAMRLKRDANNPGTVSEPLPGRSTYPKEAKDESPRAKGDKKAPAKSGEKKTSPPSKSGPGK
jgi:hypothetical protein